MEDTGQMSKEPVPIAGLPVWPAMPAPLPPLSALKDAAPAAQGTGKRATDHLVFRSYP